MALQDVLSAINFSGTAIFQSPGVRFMNAAEQTAVINSITSIYNGSQTARVTLDKINSNSQLDVFFVTSNAFAAGGANQIYLDQGFIGQLNMIDETGTVVDVSFDRVVIHEIIHAIDGLVDEPDGKMAAQLPLLTDYQGSTVGKTNVVMSELGEQTGRIAYHAVATGQELVLGTEFSNNETIDAGFLVGGTFDMSLSDRTTSDVIVGYIGGDDKFSGGKDRDFLWGRDGDDILNGGGGDDVIHGGAGTDTALYSGTCADYDFTANPNGSYTITDLRGGSPDGTDILTDIEYVKFSDGRGFIDGDKLVCPGQNVVLAVDVSGSMGDDIDAVKQQATTIVNAIFGTEDAPLGSRLAIVTFNDTGALRTELFFTDHASIADRKAAALAAIQNLAILGGGAEPLNGALLHALRGNAGPWLSDMAANRIIVFSDEPAADPQLRAQVIAESQGLSVVTTQPLGPGGSGGQGNFFSELKNYETPGGNEGEVQVFSVVIGNDQNAIGDLENLSEETGGQVFSAANASEVVDALLQAIEAPSGGTDSIIQLTDYREPLSDIIGGAGTDTWQGRRFKDVFRVESEFANLDSIEIIDGRGDIDRIQGTPGDDILDFSNAPFELVSIEQFDGSGGNDTIIGTEYDDYIIGGKGNDFLSGLGGDDTFWFKGRQGRDVIDGGDGFDTWEGSRFKDTFFVTSEFSNIANIEALDGKGGYDKIVGSKGDDILDFSSVPFTIANIEAFEGGKGNDIITGTSGDDVINAGAGNDRILIKGGNVGLDTMNGGGGFDIWKGSTGDDVFNVASQFLNIKNIAQVDGDTGFDVIRGTGGADELDFNSVSFTITGIELFDGASGDDTITGTANADRIAGGRGNDNLFGLGGDDIFQNGGTRSSLDTIDGGAGNDTWQGAADSDDHFFVTSGFGNLADLEVIDGQSGTDTIFGTDGNDGLDMNGHVFLDIEGLEGLGGNDTLGTSNTLAGVTYTGGTGEDIFVMGLADAVIADFTASVDAVDLSSFTASFSALDTDLSGLLDDGDDSVEVTGGDLDLTVDGSVFTFLGVTGLEEADLIFA